MKPCSQFVIFAVVGIWVLLNGVWMLAHSRSALDVFFGKVFLIGSQGMGYSAWHAYRRMRQNRE